MGSNTSFELHKEQVDETLSKFKSAKISDDQLQIIEEFAQILHNATKLPLINLKGFRYIAILSWQNQNKMILKEVTDFDPEERESVVRDISERLKLMLRAMLVLPKQWKSLEEAIEIGFDHYREKWKHR